MDNKIQALLKHCEFAFQPIVNISTGKLVAVECLLRNYRPAGFESIQEVFDYAYRKESLFQMDVLLREKAFEKFTTLPDYNNLKLFYNLDNRILQSSDYQRGKTTEILLRFNLQPWNLCFEISEKHSISEENGGFDIIRLYHSRNIGIALDDFGTGYSGLQFLYHSQADYIKIDRFFIARINLDMKKKLFISHIIELAHVLGIRVIAEGIETEQEYFVCKEIGCDLLQGYLVQKPVVDVSYIVSQSSRIYKLGSLNKRNEGQDKDLISQQVQNPPRIYFHHDLRYVLDCFKQNRNVSALPVLNDMDEPIGIIPEKNIKFFLYSPYGQDLLKNKSSREGIKPFIRECPITDINTPYHTILEIFASYKQGDGIILTENGKYIGFLDPVSLLKYLNLIELEQARDQNPLTKMPGNHSIQRYVIRLMEDTFSQATLVYFDFDHFKAYNDKYGFRQGDRVILLFAHILQSYHFRGLKFSGHIGGDDFFGSFDGSLPPEEVLILVKEILSSFRESVRPFYSVEDIKKNSIYAHGRDGKMKKFPLMTVSAGVLFIHEGTDLSYEELSRLLSDLKKKAKNHDEKIAIDHFPKTGASYHEQKKLVLVY